MSEVRPHRPRSWAILELTRLGERKAEEGALPPLIRDSMNLPIDHPVFIPSKTYVSGGRRITVHLMEGYAFVGSDGRDFPQPFRIDQPYIKRMLTTLTSTGNKVLSVLPDHKVRSMEAELAQHVGADSHIGSNVIVTNGIYAQMEGEVVDYASSGNLIVRFRMRSLDLITEVPPSFTVPNDGTEE